MNLMQLEKILRRLIDGIDRGLGTAVVETKKATSGEEANRAAVRGLMGVRTQIKSLKKEIDIIDRNNVT